MPFHPYSFSCSPLYLRAELSAFSWLHMHASTCTELICSCCLHAQSIHGGFSLRFQSRMCHYCCSHWEQRIHLYVPLLLEPFCSWHLGWNSLSLCHKAAAPQIGPITVGAQQQQQQQQHTVSAPCLAVDVEMGGIMSYYRVICVDLPVMTVKAALLILLDRTRC